eukprot:CAMPEP_0116552892 /NCGR_PEP_ID=MMETSP0397-20121206/6737_1 /TAXON_ID=216820 /ORGANISM="Cyclophora tenuis, Strain ECT3854" /LENGTH=63 /DNA_ID=CAMNT_0004077889 /DNA_START=53 /DNA_END=244 /DNA_ORIENTATION=+
MKGGRFVEKRILCADGTTTKPLVKLAQQLEEGETVVYCPIQSSNIIEEKVRKALRRTKNNAGW